VIGIYDMAPVTSLSAPGYKGLVFIGYDGTFNPEKVITFYRSKLASSRTVNAGPHGGTMVCGYDTSGGSKASECMWATRSTLGVVEFFVDGNPAKYNNASKLAVEVRDAVEVHAP
jgi:hypothetical protein